MELLSDRKNVGEVLKHSFGYDTFRPHQKEVVESTLAGTDNLVIMPTGGGKSICFQLPALIFEGLTIVASPLISLMKDQVQSLRSNGIPAAFLNSSLSSHEQDDIIRQVQNHQIKLLYLAPERLLNEHFLNFLKTQKLSSIAIDEAHCISAWGHDFREEYTKLGQLKDLFPDVPVAAFTATADKVTQKDIIKQLKLKSPLEFVSSFDRPNLSLNVLPAHDRFGYILQFAKDRPGQSGIVYCLSRKGTEGLSGKLNKAGIHSDHYHAGLSSQQRNKVQDDFINDRTKIICATIAFGMGIDKSNVRWIFHFNLPKNIESYYQEIGRAGRDGLPSDTTLFYSYGDVIKLRNFIEDSPIREIQLEKLQRIIQYAESQTCRRRTLLNYFNDPYTSNCGNCDICKDPPKSIDGTLIAQKAISAVIRLKEEVAMGVLIDHLRGSGKSYIIQKGYDKIATFGIGRDYSFQDWQQYIMQLIHLGFLDIAYDDFKSIKTTDAGRELVYDRKKLELVQPKKYEKGQKQVRKRVKKKTKTQRLAEELYEKLVDIRLSIANAEGIPPHVVFSDVTLNELAKARPTFPNEYAEISGMSDRKLEKYGPTFTNAIHSFKIENKDVRSTYCETFQMMQQDLSVEEIAEKKGIKPDSIANHLVKWQEGGHEVNPHDFLNAGEYEIIRTALPKEEVEEPVQFTYNQLDGYYAYWKIRLVLAFEKMKKG